MTTWGSSPREMVLPRICGSAPKRRFQKAWLSTTTFGPFGKVFILREGAPDFGRGAEQAEIIDAHLRGSELLGKAATGQVDHAGTEGGHILDHAGLLAPVLELGGRRACAGALRGGSS